MGNRTCDARRPEAVRPEKMAGAKRRDRRRRLRSHDCRGLSDDGEARSLPSVRKPSRRQSGTSSRRRSPKPRRSASPVPTKLVQLFVEPCYYALCSMSDYAGGTRPLPLQLAEAAGNERLWRLPLAIQLPSLVLLPLCVLAVAGIVVWAARRRSAASERVREIRLLLEMTVASGGWSWGTPPAR